MNDVFALRNEADHRLLTAEEEIALAQRMEAGRKNPALADDAKAARDEFITHNLRLVYSVANRYSTNDPAIDQDDLIATGMIGLIQAADKFDYRRGNRFATVAVWWIRQAISRARIESGTIKLPNAPRRREENNRLADKARRVKSLDAPLAETDRTLGDIVPSAHDTESEAITRIMADEILSTPMLPHWRAILIDHANGLSRKEAGIKNGYGRSTAWMVIKALREIHVDGKYTQRKK